LPALLAVTITGSNTAELTVHKLSVKTEGEQLAIYRDGSSRPILIQHAPRGMRPYIHPIVAPDGNGVLTEFRPSHHPHQTGLYVGFPMLNGRDYYHNLDEKYFRLRQASAVQADGGRAAWTVTYDWLQESGDLLLTEIQTWRIADYGTYYVLDIDWQGSAAVDLTFAKADFGGLFLRMPWTEKTGGDAISSEGRSNDQAEGQRARWVDLGVPLEGRSDRGHITIMDHPGNPKHPNLWRVDKQLGINPAPSRAGDWRVSKGSSTTLRYRLLIYTGPLDQARNETYWRDFGAR